MVLAAEVSNEQPRLALASHPAMANGGALAGAASRASLDWLVTQGDMNAFNVPTEPKVLPCVLFHKNR